MEILNLKTTRRNELVDITRQLQEAVAKSKVEDGICTVYVPHTTAGLVINENADPLVKADITGFLETLIPQDTDFQHSEGNSDAHIKSSLVSQSLTLIIESGKIQLGTWQAIYFFEADGPRSRQIWVKVIKG